MNMIPRVCALPSQFASLFLLFLVFRHSLMIDMTELHKEQKVDEVKSHIRASLSPPNRGVDISNRGSFIECLHLLVLDSGSTWRRRPLGNST